MHENPELNMDTPNTAKFIANKLKSGDTMSLKVLAEQV